MINLFRRPKLDHSDRDRITRLENDVAQARDDLNNLLQTVESGSRQINQRLDRLENITRVLHLREENDAS